MACKDTSLLGHTRPLFVGLGGERLVSPDTWSARGTSKVEEERPMIVDRDGGRSPGELLGEKAVGRVVSLKQSFHMTESDFARSCLKMDGV